MPLQSRFRSQLSKSPTSPNDVPPTTIFEVTKPIELPNTKPCSQLILQHDFGFTFTKPPVFADYTPPYPSCPFQDFLKIILELKATCKGTQFDRIFGVGGVELLRSCTAEPSPNGIVWTVKKDVTRNLPLNDGLWFQVDSSTKVESKMFKIPQNAYKAVLEVYVSPHQNDEFWYTKFPNEYIAKNNLTYARKNGPLREVVVSLDGKVVGAVWPFSVIYTGGFDPLLWKRISAIGSFDLPSYYIEITSSLGTILDGKTREFSFIVTNALDVWYIDANLHVWLDEKSEKIEGKVLSRSTLPLTDSYVSNFTGLNVTFLSRVSRLIKSAGWVKSSYGKITTQATQEFNFTNLMEMGNDGVLRTVHQRIDFNDIIIASSELFVDSVTSLKSFPLYLYSGVAEQGDGAYKIINNVSLGFNEKKIKKSKSGSSISSLENLQACQASRLFKDRQLVGREASTQQAYSFDSSKDCYFRNVSSSNKIISSDEENNKCSKKYAL